MTVEARGTAAVGFAARVRVASLVATTAIPAYLLAGIVILAVVGTARLIAFFAAAAMRVLRALVAIVSPHAIIEARAR